MEIRKIKLSEIQAAEYNPRRDLKPTDDEYKKLRRSIDTFGFVEPLIINLHDMKIISGHQRYKILLDLGESESEAVIVNLNQEDAKVLNIALNKIEGKWDYGKLEELFEGLQGYDLTATGFNNEEICSIRELSELISDNNPIKQKSTEKSPTPQDFEIYVSFSSKETAENWLKTRGFEVKFNQKRTATILMNGGENIETD